MRRPILTIAIPTFNMEQWLEKNLATYQALDLCGRLEVLCLNNASEDNSKAIIEKYVTMCPQIFSLIDRSCRSYGGSINAAIAQAKGYYFRIVDADDWVDTQELVKLVDTLESCDADVVLTDYQIVNMATGGMTPVRAGEKGIAYGVKMDDFSGPIRTLPSIHNTTYRTALLRESGFYMQDDMFFVDEEYVVLPYLWAQSVIYYPYDIYRYQVANPAQSTSPKNRAKFFEHREKVLKRLLKEYQAAYRAQPSDPALPYCFERICRGVGDHFTTLYMYVENRKRGRQLADEWKDYIKAEAPEFWKLVKRKTEILLILNCFRVDLRSYAWLKERFLS